MIAAEAALRAWVNAKPYLVGQGRPLAGGAFLRQQRSPSDGAYAVVVRATGSSQVVAETDGGLCTAVVVFQTYSPSEETSETACAAIATAIEELTGLPQPCGTTGVRVLVHDKLTGPVFVPTPATTGEPYSFQVSAEFMLAQP